MQERGQEAHQCFWVAAKMGETWLKSAVRKTGNTVISVAEGPYVKKGINQSVDQRASMGDGARNTSARRADPPFTQHALERQ